MTLEPLHLDITKDNFEKYYSQIANEMSRAKFIAFDGEFSGITVSRAHEANYCDCENLRYEKLKISAKKFEVVQFGFCLFLHDPDEDEDDDNIEEEEEGEEEEIKKGKPTAMLIPRAYNFHIFKDFDRACHTFSNSSVRFLRNNKMDFHKFIEKGIPYLNEREESELRKYYQQKVDAYYQTSSSSSSSTSSTATKIPKTSYSAEDHLYISTIHKQLVTWFHKQLELPCTDIRPKTSYHRKLIYDNFQNHEDFPTGSIYISSESDDNGYKFLRIWRLQSTDNNNNDDSSSSPTSKIEEKNEQIISEKIGFSRIIKLLRNVNCPITGHYCILDLLHLQHKCVYPLPESVFEMKAQLKTSFSMPIIDTKILASRHDLKDYCGRNTSLKALYDHCMSQYYYHRKTITTTTNNIILDISPLEVDKSKIGAHVASFDAYMTGVVFALCVSKVVEKQQNNNTDNKDNNNIDFVFQNISSIVQTDVLYMMRWPHPLYLTVNPTQIPSYVKQEQSFQYGRKKVFFISNLSNVQTEDINKVFSKYGRIQICWINSRCAFIKLMYGRNKKKKNNVIVYEPVEVIRETRNRRFIVTTYEDALVNGILMAVLYEGICGGECKRNKRFTPCDYDLEEEEEENGDGKQRSSQKREVSESKRFRFCSVM